MSESMVRRAERTGAVDSRMVQPGSMDEQAANTTRERIRAVVHGADELVRIAETANGQGWLRFAGMGPYQEKWNELVRVVKLWRMDNHGSEKHIADIESGP